VWRRRRGRRRARDVENYILFELIFNQKFVSKLVKDVFRKY
jgi:hypothetical protein